MKTIVRIKDLGLAKLNNDEYTSHMTRSHAMILATGAEALGVEAESAATACSPSSINRGANLLQ